jgi:uncharacterized surface anchored protein
MPPTITADRRPGTHGGRCLLACAFFALACVAPQAQPPQPSQNPAPQTAPTPQNPAKPAEPQGDEPTLKRAPTFASIAGTVHSAATGDPLPGAEVQAIEKDGKDFQIAKADASGAYQILGLVAGSYVVTSSLSGYVSGKLPQESWRAPPFYLVLAAAQQVTNIDFRLMKNSSITGVISGEDGRPLAGISVQALSRYYTHQGSRLEQRGSGRTDSQGRYRITALAAGNYFVRAMKVVGPEGYGSVFYPNVTDLTEAKPVNLLIGRDVQGIDLRLTKSAGHRVIGKLVDLRTDMQVKEGYTVTLAPEIGATGVLATIAKDGTFEFGSLIPGKYRLTASMTDLATGAPFRATKILEVGQADITDLQVKICAGATVRVKVSLSKEAAKETASQDAKGEKEGDEPTTPATKEPEVPRRLSLALVRREEAEDPGRISVALRYAIQDANTYEFHNVPAGEYFLILGYTTRPDTRRFFLEQVMGDAAQDVRQTGLMVPEGLGTVRISATVNLHGGIINGTATDGKKQPILGRAIVLVAADRAQRHFQHATLVTWTDSNGAFRFTGVVPGEYLAVLWTGSDPGEAMNPAYYDELEHNGAPVHVAPGAEVMLGLKTGG